MTSTQPIKRAAENGDSATAGSAAIGLISDTHGPLRPEIAPHFTKTTAILHAGDIVAPEVIEQLAAIAPLYAVAGNMDRDRRLPQNEFLTIAGRNIYVLHNLDRLGLDPAAAGIEIVVFGHTHRPESFTRNGILYVNPGSAGPRRGSLPVSIAKLHLRGNEIRVEFIELD